MAAAAEAKSNNSNSNKNGSSSNNKKINNQKKGMNTRENSNINDNNFSFPISLVLLPLLPSLRWLWKRWRPSMPRERAPLRQEALHLFLLRPMPSPLQEDGLRRLLLPRPPFPLQSGVLLFLLPFALRGGQEAVGRVFGPCAEAQEALLGQAGVYGRGVLFCMVCGLAAPAAAVSAAAKVVAAACGAFVATAVVFLLLL